MAEEPQTGAAPEQPAMPQMQINAQFIRDMSFENFLVQKGVTGDVTPDVKVQVALDAKKRPTDNQYEVITKFQIKADNKGDGAPMFLMELEYGGVFTISNIPDEQLHPYLLIECPRMLFPFARRIVSDVTRDGGFPPLNLETVDFVALYRQELARRAQAQAEGAAVN